MWLYKGREVNETDTIGNVAFVYIITNLVTGEKYIGKKNLQTYRRKKVKGRTRKKRVVTESEWTDYFGSNNRLLDDVANLGKENFKREILHFCKTRGTANYLELREQIDRRVLEKSDFYNEQCYARVHKSHIKL